MSQNTACFMLLIILPLLSINCFVTSDNSAWEKVRAEFFAGAIIHENTSDNLFIQVPKKVEDAAIVPIKITSLMPQSKQHYIKSCIFLSTTIPFRLQPFSIYHRLLLLRGQSTSLLTFVSTPMALCVLLQK